MKMMYFIWSLIERFGANFISLADNIILTYLLAPEDFGLVSMLAVFTGLIFVFVDCGLSDGLLMRGNPTDRDFNTVFYFNVAVGTAIAILYCSISPLVARFLGRPELQPLMVAFGLGAILSGLSIAQATRLRSQLQFRRIAIINIMSISLALVTAIVMAECGLRYWALVELQVGFSGFYLLQLILFSKWHLRWEFDVESFKHLWKFGVNLLFSTIVNQVSQNIFTLILGKYYNPARAGYMGQAQKLQQTPTNSIEMAISSTSFVLISKYSTVQEKCAAILRMFGVMTFVNSLFMAAFLSLSYPIIDVIFSDKWLPVVPYFCWMLAWGPGVPGGQLHEHHFQDLRQDRGDTQWDDYRENERCGAGVCALSAGRVCNDWGRHSALYALAHPLRVLREPPHEHRQDAVCEHLSAQSGHSRHHRRRGLSGHVPAGHQHARGARAWGHRLCGRGSRVHQALAARLLRLCCGARQEDSAPWRLNWEAYSQ